MNGSMGTHTRVGIDLLEGLSISNMRELTDTTTHEAHKSLSMRLDPLCLFWNSGWTNVLSDSDKITTQLQHDVINIHVFE